MAGEKNFNIKNGLNVNGVEVIDSSGSITGAAIGSETIDDRVASLLTAGAGIGFMTVKDAESHPDMVQIAPPRPEWYASLWLVSHVDLHRTAKVQAFLKFVKEQAKDWNAA